MSLLNAKHNSQRRYFLLKWLTYERLGEYSLNTKTQPGRVQIQCNRKYVSFSYGFVIILLLYGIDFRLRSRRVFNVSLNLY